HANPIHFTRDLLIRKSGKRVLLLDKRWYAAPRRCHQHRATRESTRTDNHIRTKRLEDRLCLEVTRHDLYREKEVRQRESALQTTYPQANDLVSRLRHTRHLHSPLRAHEQNLSLRIPFAKLVGDSQRRKNVTTRSSSAYDHSIWFLFIQILCYAALLAILFVEIRLPALSDCVTKSSCSPRLTLRIMPIASPENTIDVPPMEMSGKGCPVIGPSPTTTPMLTNA